jgi:hypothetical protein
VTTPLSASTVRGAKGAGGVVALFACAACVVFGGGFGIRAVVGTGVATCPVGIVAGSGVVRTGSGTNPDGGTSSSVGNWFGAASVSVLGCEDRANGTATMAPSPMRTPRTAIHSRRDGGLPDRPSTALDGGGSSHESSATTNGPGREFSVNSGTTTCVPMTPVGTTGRSGHGSGSAAGTGAGGSARRGGAGGSSPGLGQGAMMGMIVVTELSATFEAVSAS